MLPQLPSYRAASGNELSSYALASRGSLCATLAEFLVTTEGSFWGSRGPSLSHGCSLSYFSRRYEEQLPGLVSSSFFPWILIISALLLHQRSVRKEILLSAEFQPSPVALACDFASFP